METIDGDDVPLELVIDQILTPEGLRQLMGYHGVICFALARSAVLPSFYEALIDGVATIDGTTGRHVAFAMFYGRTSTAVTPHPDGQRYYAHSIVGLSSTDEYGRVHLERGSRRGARGFSPELTDRLRWSADDRVRHAVARSSEYAASILMQKLGIFDVELPCLVFVDAESFETPVVVPLDPANALGSLYTQVLAPMGDAFRQLEAYWDRFRSARYEVQAIARAQATVDGHPAALEALRARLLEAETKSSQWTGAQPPEWVQLEIEESQTRAALGTFRRTQDLHKRFELIPTTQAGWAETAEAMDALTALEAEKKGARPWQYQDPARYSSLATRLNQTRQYAAQCLERHVAAFQNRLRELASARARLNPGENPFASTIAKLHREIADYPQERENALKVLAQANEAKLSEDERQLSLLAQPLREGGFGDKVLAVEYPRACDVVRSLFEAGRIGYQGPPGEGPAPIRILFLAANPIESGRLDLEEELRGLEQELRGVRHRDRIELISGHAVRPDDLVRLVRQHTPTVVHFSGHGSTEGIALRHDDGRTTIVRQDALARLLMDRGVRLVMLNACYSADQADALLASVPCVVGTTDAVGDEAARRFSVAFYRTLGDGHSISSAFIDGATSVDLHNLRDVYVIRGAGEEILLPNEPGRFGAGYAVGRQGHDRPKSPRG